MVRRRVGVASVNESVWASLFYSCTERTYLDTSTVPPQWFVTIANTQRDSSRVYLTSDICYTSSASPTLASAPAKKKAERNNKR